MMTRGRAQSAAGGKPNGWRLATGNLAASDVGANEVLISSTRARLAAYSAMPHALLHIPWT